MPNPGKRKQQFKMDVHLRNILHYALNGGTLTIKQVIAMGISKTWTYEIKKDTALLQFSTTNNIIIRSLNIFTSKFIVYNSDFSKILDITQNKLFSSQLVDDLIYKIHSHNIVQICKLQSSLYQIIV
ncbi:Hypothetical_protein [Hexamita inflata]|uniref:Hypothetical_protein n=1 Tax=Hexamita inflata TaxID=28002 RepID=A0AA86TXI7_9EUKA|nr:Hypothetical protein HINF_LOCUS20234 [Hexamita inflata]